MAKKKDSNPKGCRLCKYRVAPPKGPNNERVPCCCFGYKINDKERPSECGDLFSDTDFYIRHPEEP